MNTRKVVTAVIAIALFLPACKKATVQQPAIPEAVVPKNNIAYIYKTDSTDAHAYKMLLEENECHVTLIEKAKAATTSFKKYKLIIIDNNTDEIGFNGTWANGDTAAIEAAKTPLLLMGIGGLQYANKIKNIVNYLSAASWDDKGFWVSDKVSPLFKTPFVISIPTSTPQIKLYNTNERGEGMPITGTAPAGLTIFGSFILAKNYCNITVEKGRYVFFGFHKGVDAMTQEGRNFMVNLAFFAGKLEL